jgi:hypothetical protein
MVAIQIFSRPEPSGIYSIVVAHRQPCLGLWHQCLELLVFASDPQVMLVALSRQGLTGSVVEDVLCANQALAGHAEPNRGLSIPSRPLAPGAFRSPESARVGVQTGSGRSLMWEGGLTPIAVRIVGAIAAIDTVSLAMACLPERIHSIPGRACFPLRMV